MNANKQLSWECFRDPSYFDMWAVKQISNQRFDEAYHVTSEVEARRLCALLNTSADLNTTKAKAAPAEPFGYFRAEPFGWTDCAATDEGAIALYERPAAHAVPEGEPEAYMVYGNYTRQPFRSIESAQAYIGGLLKSDPEGGYHIRPLFYATPAAPSQEPALHIGACITDGVLHATVMRREANGHVTILAKAEMDAKSLLERDCLAEMSRATPSQPAVPSRLLQKLDASIAWLESGEVLPGTSACIGLNDIKTIRATLAAAPSQPVTLTDSYAGVIAWVGDKQCKRVLTEAAIKHEHTPGVAMRNTAHQCVQEVIIAALREKGQV